MRRSGIGTKASRALVALMLLSISVAAKPPGAPAAAAPLPPLPILPSVARVKVTCPGNNVIAVTQEVNLPRGDWKNEPLAFHIAFGSPGPKAVDVHLVPVADGELEPAEDDPGEPITTERVPRRPANAYSLLGRDSMAGIVVHLRPDVLAKAFSRGGNMASLRIRSVADVTTPDQPEESVVVRLGSSRGTPLTLGRIVATSSPPGLPIARAEAKLCGPEASTLALAVNVTPKVPHTEPVIAPVLAVRHASDDLCIKVSHAPAAAPPASK